MHTTPPRIGTPPRALRAFTLIGMMVAIAIVGILFSIALTSYQSNVLKTRRYAAQSCLVEYSQYMERYYTTNTSNPMSFTGATLQSAACATSLSTAYAFTLPTLTSSTYILTATAIGAQTNDTACTPLTLKQDGSKTPVSGCWP